MDFKWYDEPVDSTQSIARRLLSSQSPPFAVAASSQTSGKGTSHREWFSPQGNLYLTVCVPSAPLFKSRLPITLLPLKVGCVTSSAIRNLLPPSSSSCVKLKWPNDVLMDRRKVSGVLIEMEGDALLVGVGVNVMYAPVIPTEGSNVGRESACIGEYVTPRDPDAAIRGLGEEIALELGAWFEGLPSAEAGEGDGVVREFSEQVEFGVRIRMREGGWVVPVKIECDGQIVVRSEDTGEVKTLCSDYML